MPPIAPAILALASLLASPEPPRDSPPPGGPPLVHPELYCSSSGRFALTVDPTHPHGHGPALVQLARDGEPNWSSDFPFTPLTAVISDDGFTATLGRDSSSDGRRWLPRQFLRLTAPTGELLIDAALDPDSGRFAPALRLCLVEELRRLVVWSAEGGARWWVIDLATGKTLLELDPIALQPFVPYDLELHAEPAGPVLNWALSLHALPGTPLCIAQWQHSADVPRRDLGTRYALLDAALQPVWILEERSAFHWPMDDATKERFWRVMHSGVHDLPAASTFSLLVDAGAQVARFEVEPDASAQRGWSVRELSRTPWVAPTELETSSPRIELEPRPPIALPAPGVGPAGAFAVGPSGRLHVRLGTRGSGDIHVFTADGQPLHVLRPKPSDLGNGRAYPGDLVVDERNHVFLQHPSDSPTWIWFDADGKRIGLIELGRSPVHLQPRTGARWILSRGTVRLADSTGALLSESERRPDNRWLEITASGLARDGSLVLLSRSSHHGGDTDGTTRWYGPEVLAWYAPDGTPGRVVELTAPTNRWYGHLLVADDWIVLAGSRPALDLVRISDGEHARFSIEAELERRGPWIPSLSPSRDELLWLDGTTWTVHRFALPP